MAEALILYEKWCHRFRTPLLTRLARLALKQEICILGVLPGFSADAKMNSANTLRTMVIQGCWYSHTRMCSW